MRFLVGLSTSVDTGQGTLISKAGLFAAPALYAPAGGVSGRTTFAAVTWLIGWAVLHRRWKDRQLEPSRIFMATLVLIALGIVLTFPPVWQIVG